MPDGVLSTPPAAGSANFSVGEQAHPVVKWFLLSAVLAVLISGLSFGWTVILGGRLNSLATERTTLEGQVASKENTALAERISSVKKAQDGLDRAIKTQTPTLNLFVDIESRLTKDVKLLTLSLTEKGEVKLEGELPSMTSLAKNMLSLKANAAFSQFRLSGVGVADSTSPRTRFSLTFVTDLKKFAQQQAAKAASTPASAVAPAAGIGSTAIKPPAAKSSLLPRVVEQSAQAKE